MSCQSHRIVLQGARTTSCYFAADHQLHSYHRAFRPFAYSTWRVGLCARQSIVSFDTCGFASTLKANAERQAMSLVDRRRGYVLTRRATSRLGNSSNAMSGTMLRQSANLQERLGHESDQGRQCALSTSDSYQLCSLGQSGVPISQLGGGWWWSICGNTAQ